MKMFTSETSITAYIKSKDRLLGLEGSEIVIAYEDGEVGLMITEYRDTEKYDDRRGESLTIYLTEEQIARMSQIISDWLDSRTRESFDKIIGRVNGEVDVFVDDGIKREAILELRIALDNRGIFFSPGTGSDWPTQIRIPEDSDDSVSNVSHFRDMLLDILELSTTSQGPSLKKEDVHDFEYDVFICHSSSDKKGVVEPLAEHLEATGLHVWYDDFEISIGDDIRKAIESGINNSRYGLIILSDDFLEADWAAAELSSLTSREHSENLQKILLPLRYDIEMDKIREKVPLLASRFAPVISDETIEDVSNQVHAIIDDGE